LPSRQRLQAVLASYLEEKTLLLPSNCLGYQKPKRPSEKEGDHMIHYHGLPINPDSACAQIIHGAHVLISHRYPEQLGIAASAAKSFVLDNGAFSAWKKGEPVTDWQPYLQWSLEAMTHPNCDWVIVPDVIDGSERENDELIGWFLSKWAARRKYGNAECVPVWHLHESFGRLARLASWFTRVALGSSGEFATPKTPAWWARIGKAIRHISDSSGKLPCKLHGLRMLDPEIFTKLPLSSADSTAVARSIGLDCRWTGSYRPPTKAARGILMRQRIEQHNSASIVFDINLQTQGELFA
jgi:hypothetical protein